MASNSEITFGARVVNASKISAHLKTLAGYIAPTTNTTIPNYDILIAASTSENKSIATKKAVKSQYGVGSTEYKLIKGLKV